MPIEHAIAWCKAWPEATTPHESAMLEEIERLRASDERRTEALRRIVPDSDVMAPRRRLRDNREHRFQSWVDRLLDRIVLPPMFTTGIDHASQTTDNARARMGGRGIKFGVPDVFVCQGINGASVWLELKRGSSVSTAQQGVHLALRKAGQNVAVCDTMAAIVEALRGAGFFLHRQADELAREYEARCVAKERAPATPKRAAPKRLRRMGWCSDAA